MTSTDWAELQAIRARQRDARIQVSRFSGTVGEPEMGIQWGRIALALGAMTLTGIVAAYAAEKAL